MDLAWLNKWVYGIKGSISSFSWLSSLKRIWVGRPNTSLAKGFSAVR
jgi:hypothetical protein